MSAKDTGRHKAGPYVFTLTTMTTRIYFTDSQARTFDAIVEACEPAGDRFEVRLDQTAFYPTSGGQPFDTGRLDSVDVVDVIERDDAIVHVVTERLEPGTTVSGQIDWDRRRDHMQQHTGQHILSAAFDRTCGVATVAFHMGADVSTIDLAREVTMDEIVEAEGEANRLVQDNRPVRVRFVTAEEAENLPLRRASARTGDLRIVEVPDVDVSACGGTHVQHTGEVGVVVSLSTERVRGGTRVGFLCGDRAVAGFQRMRQAASDAARMLGVPVAGMAAHVARLQEAVRDAERQARHLREELAGLRVAAWQEAAETIGGCRVVLRADANLDAGALKSMAHAIVAERGYLVVLVGGGEPAPVVVARSSDIAFDAAGFVKRAASEFGGRGGGRAELAQGGLAASADAILTWARQLVVDAPD